MRITFACPACHATAMLDRVEELQQEAGRRYLELQEQAAAALSS